MILYYFCQLIQINFLSIFHPYNFLHLSQKFQLYLIILYFCRDFNIILYQLYFHLYQYSVFIHHYKNYIYSV